MKFHSLPRLSLLLVGLALAAPVLSAAPGSTGSASTSATAPEVTPRRFTLEIRNNQIIDGGKPIGGATIGAILDYLKSKNTEFNLSLGPGVSNVVVGDMILNMDTFGNYAFCQAIAVAASEPLNFNPDVPALVLVDQPQHDVAVFNLTSYLNPNGNADEKSIKSKVDSITQIIANTLSDANRPGSSGGRLAFQFHAGANLLVVSGNQQAIDIANKVVNALIPQGSSDAIFTTTKPKQWANPDSIVNVAAQWAQAQPTTSLNDAQMQAVMNVLKRAEEQSSATPEEAAKQAPPASSQNVVQLQAALDASKRAEALQKELLSAQTPEQAKQLQKALEELGKSTQDLINKNMQDLDRLKKSMQNNNPVIIPSENASGNSSTQSFPGNYQNSP